MPRPVTLALALAALLAPSSAFALDCAVGPLTTLPLAEATDVPTNAVVRVLVEGSFETADLRLLDADGQVVSTDLQEHPQGSQTLLTLTPDAPLAAASRFSIDYGQDWTGPSFTTGSATDTEAPDAPAIQSVRRDDEMTEWGPVDEVIVEVEGPGEAALYELSVTDAEDGSPMGIVYGLGYSASDSIVAVGAGQGLCSDTLDLPAQVEVEVVAIDVAGNRSDGSGNLEVVRPSSGCSALAGPVGVGALLFPLGLTLMRRRRAL